MRYKRKHKLRQEINVSGEKLKKGLFYEQFR